MSDPELIRHSPTQYYEPHQAIDQVAGDENQSCRIWELSPSVIQEERGNTEAIEILRQIEEEIAQAKAVGSSTVFDSLDPFSSVTNSIHADAVKWEFRDDSLVQESENDIPSTVNVDKLFSGPIQYNHMSSHSPSVMATYGESKPILSDSGYSTTPDTLTPRNDLASSIPYREVVNDASMCCFACGTPRPGNVSTVDNGTQTDPSTSRDVAVQANSLLSIPEIDGGRKRDSIQYMASQQIKLSKRLFASKAAAEKNKDRRDILSKSSPPLPPPSLVSVPVPVLSSVSRTLPSRNSSSSLLSMSSECPSTPGRSFFSTSPSRNNTSDALSWNHPSIGESTVGRFSAKESENAIWLQCDDCDKWRLIAPDEVPTPLPETWTCKSAKAAATLENPCSLPEDVQKMEDAAAVETIEDSEWVVVAHREGDVVYAKMRGFPYWPAILESPVHPAAIRGDGSFFFKKSDKEVEYHVTFFDSPPTTSWVKEENIFSFASQRGKDANAGNKRLFRFKSPLMDRFKVGESIAEEALKQGDVKTRLESFGLLGLDKHMEVFNTGGKRKRGRKKMVSKKARSSSTKTDDSQAGDTTQNAGSFLESSGSSSKVLAHSSRRSFQCLASTGSEANLASVSHIVTSTPRPGASDLAWNSTASVLFKASDSLLSCDTSPALDSSV